MLRRAGARLLVALAILGVCHLAFASGMSLEGGLIPALYVPMGSEADEVFFGGGLSGTVGYEWDHWGFAARIMGTLSNHTDMHFSAESLDIKGELMRRQYGLSILSRYFFQDSQGQKRWYIELGFMGNETEFVHSGSVYVLPQSPDYTRIFMRGGSFSIGTGYRPVKGPWFFQFNYLLTHYDALEITGNVKFLHPILENPTLSQTYFVHTFFITVGLDVFGRESR